MKAPKLIAAMAIAAVLSSGVAPAYADFVNDPGNASNGQQAMQKTDKHEAINTPGQPQQTQLKSSGDIEISGQFSKTINSFPVPDKAGRYLRVTMPIKMDYSYNVDNNQMVAATGTITNNSVYVTTSSGSQLSSEDQPITMSLVDVVDGGVGTTNNIPTQFVDTVIGNNTNGITNPSDKVLLPFELTIQNGSANPVKHNITAIQRKNVNNTNGNGLSKIDIQKNSTVQLELGLINGETVGNTNLINAQKSLTSHSLKLQFEYNGK